MSDNFRLNILNESILKKFASQNYRFFVENRWHFADLPDNILLKKHLHIHTVRPYIVYGEICSIRTPSLVVRIATKRSTNILQRDGHKQNGLYEASLEQSVRWKFSKTHNLMENGRSVKPFLQKFLIFRRLQFCIITPRRCK